MSQDDLPRLPEMADEWQTTLAWQPDATQQAKLQQFYEQILVGNRQLNLTRITEPAEFWEKHLWDSLRGIASDVLTHRHSIQVMDIGTGAGMPGVPIAIAHPDWQVTLLDSTQKKINFLQEAVLKLGLSNVVTLVGRAEQLGRTLKHREHYDLVTVRAVATASVCAEYALPLLKVGGQAVLYRGQWTEEETQHLEQAVSYLGGTIAAIESFTTPLSQSVRHCVYLTKVAPTPAGFPRAIGIPTQKPL